MRAADTNVLVRILVRDDVRQVRAAESFLAAGPVWISHLVLVETIWVLGSVYGVKRRELADAVQKLLDHAVFSVQDADVVATALDTFRRHGRVQFSDCMMLAVALRAGHQPVATFDRALARVEGTTHL